MLSSSKRGNKTLKRNVSIEEILKFQRNSSDHWIWKRAEIIRLASAGYNNLEIQEITGVDEKNIRDWINRFNALGFPGLSRRKTTTEHNGKLTSAEIEYLKEILKNPPSLFGYNVFAWTVKLVWQLIQDIFGIQYHRKYIYSLLGRIGFKIAKPYPIHIKQNEEEVERFYSQVLPALQKKAKIRGKRTESCCPRSG